RLLHRNGDRIPGNEPELGIAEGLVQHMRLAHQAMPYLRWSYYFADDRRFVTLYPQRLNETLGGALRTLSDDEAVEVMFAEPITAGSTNERPTDAYWTPAFLDPAGAGWMIAYAQDVPANEGKSGLVATAVLLDFLTGFIRAFDYPCGKVWLVNDQRQILAASDGRRATADGLRLLTLDDVLPEALRRLDTPTLTGASSRFKTFDDVSVLSRPITATPWHLLYVVEPGEVTALIMPRFIPYGVILIGLLLTFVAAQLLRKKLIIGPALALADYVKSESQEFPTPAPDLPAMWRPWIKTVSEAFEARRDAAKRIQESEAYFRTMAEAHPVPVAIVKLDDGQVLHASHAFAKLFATSLDDLIGSNIRRHYDVPEDRDQVIRTLREQGGVQNFEHWVRRADGSRFLASASSRPIEFNGFEAVVSGVVDLTEKKAAEAKIAEQREALRRSEQRFRTIAEGHPVPLAIVRRADQKILYVSRPMADVLRISLRELYLSDPRDFYARAEDRRRIGEILETRPAVESVEIEVRRLDGSVFPAALSSKMIDYEGDVAVVSSIVDLTEKRKAEQEIARQREALHQAEKLNALGSLLASVAHELNNPLSVVIGYATMQLEMCTDATTKVRAEKIQAAAERCARIVKTFLAMARQKEELRGPVELNQVIEAALEIASYGLRTADVELALSLDPDLPSLYGDGDQLTLVFMNLVVNAQHALQAKEGARHLAITTGRTADTVWVELADNGPGIKADIVTRIFDPFFTTKPQGVGTGIGLSVSNSIATAHEGEITVASTLTGGALFRVSLPVVDPASKGSSTLAETAPSPRVRGRIMVVEDEPEIADMVAEMLRGDGHDVLVAHSGRAALDQIGGEGLDLVISDLRMPGLSGTDLHHMLSMHHPGIAERMLFMTGDTLGYELGDFFERTGLPLLEKPLEPALLRQEVQNLLAGYNS
ncbi:MAG: hybrid sensor histidine kinase/response regulator, partial [Geminicoccaceae bacterium]